jgi:hypothetical protein
MNGDLPVRDRIARQVEARNGCDADCPSCAKTADTLASTSPMIPDARRPQ